MTPKAKMQTFTLKVVGSVSALVVFSFQSYGQQVDPRLTNPAARTAAIQQFHSQATSVVQIPTLAGKLITFDVPGAVGGSFTGTAPVAINSLGEIAGGYCTATTCPGFVRNPDGAITTFNVTGATSVGVSGINVFGEITGYAYGPTGILATRPAFIRAYEGAINVFNFPGPGSNFTTPGGINDVGAIAGYYANASGFHGFLRSGEGVFTTFDVPSGVNQTYGDAINVWGAVTGEWFDVQGAAHGFLRFPGGALTPFNPPAPWGSSGDYLQPYGINTIGEITGYYFRAAETATHAFLRTPDGTFLTIDPPGSSSSSFTVALGINEVGTVVGIYQDANGSHVFLRSWNGTFGKFDVPGAVNGYFPVAIMPFGPVTVAGTWFDANNFAHGFVFQSFDWQ